MTTRFRFGTDAGKLIVTVVDPRFDLGLLKEIRIMSAGGTLVASTAAPTDISRFAAKVGKR